MSIIIHFSLLAQSFFSQKYRRQTGASAITTYINDYVYQETATITTTTPAPLGAALTLSFINFEEGRVRVMTPLSQDSGYDIIMRMVISLSPNNKSGMIARISSVSISHANQSVF